jgi:release factor glutamine methyltransferase
VGTGSGAIACALASRVPGLEVTAVDCSVAALAVAARNVEAHGLADRVRLVAGDLLDPLRVLGATVDMIVANLPYLPSAVIPTLPAEVSRSEPRLALDGGADGMVLVRRAILEAPAVLAPGGRLLMEIGEGQSWPLASLMAAQGFAEVVSRRDLNGVERYLGGRWAAASASAAALDQRTR